MCVSVCVCILMFECVSTGEDYAVYISYTRNLDFLFKQNIPLSFFFLKYSLLISFFVFKLLFLLFIGEPNGRLFRRSIDTLLRDKEMLVADIIQKASDCMKEDILDRRASTPPSLYQRTSFSESNESNENESENEEKSSITEIFKKNEKENEIMMSNNSSDENENKSVRKNSA